MAANTDGRREIIGLGLGPFEAESFWMDFLRGLKARCLDGTKLVISAAHSGPNGAQSEWRVCSSGGVCCAARALDLLKVHDGPAMKG